MALFRPLASSRSDQVLLLSFAIRAPNHGGAQAALHSRNRYRANLFRGFQVLAGVWLCGWGLDETVRRTLKKQKRKRIEESFGWLKTIARMRKVRRWGIHTVESSRSRRLRTIWCGCGICCHQRFDPL